MPIHQLLYEYGPCMASAAAAMPPAEAPIAVRLSKAHAKVLLAINHYRRQPQTCASCCCSRTLAAPKDMHACICILHAYPLPAHAPSSFARALAHASSSRISCAWPHGLLLLLLLLLTTTMPLAASPVPPSHPQLHRVGPGWRQHAQSPCQ